MLLPLLTADGSSSTADATIPTVLRQFLGAAEAASLYVVGMAIDIRVPGRPLERVRDVARALRGGGVGYYQASNFVHVDVGHIRYW